MSSNKVVYVDIDGVVAKFTEAAMLAHNIPHDRIPHYLSSMHGAYDIEKHLNIEPTKFWSHLSSLPDFWANIPLDENANSLINFLTERVDSNSLYFCTSPTNCPHCYSGKARWVATYFPSLKRHLIIAADKHRLAHKNAILIDDSDAKVNLFRAHGGRAVLYPRPWNSLHHFSANGFSIVTKELRRLL